MQSTFTVKQKVVNPVVKIQKKLHQTQKNLLSSQGIHLLNNQINNIIERQKESMHDNNNPVQDQDLKRLKKNLKIYGKYQKQFHLQKIINIGFETPQPRKNIVKVHQNKFTIAKQHSIKLSQKIDVIIQEQNILSMKNAKRQHLQSKLQAPLIKKLRRFDSMHNIGGTERKLQIQTRESKQQSSWTQRTACFEGCRWTQQKTMEKYERGKSLNHAIGIRFNLSRSRNNLQSLITSQKQSLQKFTSQIEGTKFTSRANCMRRLKRKAIEYS